MKIFASERRLFEKQNGDWVVQVYEKAQRRELRFGNNIVQGAISLGSPDLPLLEYIRAMLTGLVFCPQPESVLHLGLGTGSIPRFLYRYASNVRQRVVEINPDVIEAAYKCLAFPSSSRLLITEGDAREFIRGDTEQYDMIFVDAYHPDGAAADLDRANFFKALGERVVRNGWVINNTWGSNEEQLKRVHRRMSAEFPSLYAISVRSHSNVIFIGSPSPQSFGGLLLAGRAAVLQHHIPFDFSSWVRKIKPLGTYHRDGVQQARA